MALNRYARPERESGPSIRCNFVRGSALLSSMKAGTEMQSDDRFVGRAPEGEQERMRGALQALRGFTVRDAYPYPGTVRR